MCNDIRRGVWLIYCTTVGVEDRMSVVWEKGVVSEWQASQRDAAIFLPVVHW